MKIESQTHTDHSPSVNWRQACAGGVVGALFGVACGGFITYAASRWADSSRFGLIWLLILLFVVLNGILGKRMPIPNSARKTGSGSGVIGLAVGVAFAEGVGWARPDLRMPQPFFIVVPIVGALLLAYGLAALCRESRG